MGVLNDDAVALFMLLNTPDVEVLGVTIVPGNTWMEHGTAEALRQLELVGRTDIPVFMGVREPLMGSRQPWLEAEERLWGQSEYLGAYGRPRPESYLALDREPAIGYPTSKPAAEHAVDFLVRAIKAHPNEVTLFVLGPATNVALAIRKNPEIVPLVKRVFYMGGAIDVPGNTTPAAEFNWWFDPEATRITLRAPFREQIVVPLDIAERVFYTKAEYDRIVGRARDADHRSCSGSCTGRASRRTRAAVLRLGRADRRRSSCSRRSRPSSTTASSTSTSPTAPTTAGRSATTSRGGVRSTRPADFPAGTQKVKVLMDIDRKAFWDLYVDLMTRRR